MPLLRFSFWHNSSATGAIRAMQLGKRETIELNGGEKRVYLGGGGGRKADVGIEVELREL